MLTWFCPCLRMTWAKVYELLAPVPHAIGAMTTTTEPSTRADFGTAPEKPNKGIPEKPGELWLPEEFQAEKTLPVDSTRYPFREALAQVIGEPPETDLSELHNTEAGREVIGHFQKRPDKVVALGPRGNPWNRRFLACAQRERALWQRFVDLYHDFLRTFVLEDMRTTCIAFQATPTFRCHLPGCGTVGRPHRDEDYHHPRCEMNYWIPVTPVSGTNTLYAESRRGCGDFHPFELAAGHLMRFYANQVWHYTVPNESSSTRVSFDFRVLRREDWTPAAFTHFRLGAYYSVMTSTGVLSHADSELRRLQEEFGCLSKPKKNKRSAAEMAESDACVADS